MPENTIQFIPQRPSKAVQTLESEIEAHPSFSKTIFRSC